MYINSLAKFLETNHKPDNIVPGENLERICCVFLK